MPSAAGEALLQILKRLFLGRRALGTVQFREMRHNNDLVPAVQARLEAILERYSVQKAISYDIQGLRDEGADVVVRVVHGDPSRSPEYICFQVKAHDELGEGRVASTLREQHSRAVDRYSPMLQYYILPFGVVDRRGRGPDGQALLYDDDRRDVIRRIDGEMIQKPEVTVVDPRNLVGFLALTEPRIDAYFKSVLGQDDPVRRQFEGELEGFSSRQVALLARLAALSVAEPCTLFSVEEIARDQIVAAAFDEPELWREGHEWLVDDWFDDEGSSEPAVALSELEDLVDREGDRFRLAPGAIPAVRAMMLDAHVRFDHGPQELVDYSLWIMRLDDPEAGDSFDPM